MLKMTDRVYDIAKWLVSVVLPALGILYVALSDVFGLLVPDSVMATVMAIVLFMGMFVNANGQKWAMARLEATGTMIRDTNLDGIPDYPFRMSGDLYDSLKWLTQVFLPAVAVMYTSMGDIWSLPNADTVSVVLGAFIIFMSSILQFSSTQWAKAGGLGLPPIS